MGTNISALLDEMQVNYCNLTEDKTRHASLVVAGHALSAEDCAELLQILGLI